MVSSDFSESPVMDLSPDHASRLLDALDRSVLASSSLTAGLERDSDWIHPATDERLARCEALEDCIRRLLVLRCAGNRVSKL
jgi:hypothetical protein